MKQQIIQQRWRQKSIWSKQTDSALNAFTTFESKMHDWRILAGGILKCLSQENRGQNTVKSSIYDIACAGNIVSGDI